MGEKTFHFSGNVISWYKYIQYKKLTENRDFSKKEEQQSLPEMFKQLKKVSQAYTKILQSNPEYAFGPKNTIEKKMENKRKKWKIKLLEESLQLLENILFTNQDSTSITKTKQSPAETK